MRPPSGYESAVEPTKGISIVQIPTNKCAQAVRARPVWLQVVARGTQRQRITIFCCLRVLISDFYRPPGGKIRVAATPTIGNLKANAQRHVARPPGQQAVENRYRGSKHVISILSPSTSLILSQAVGPKWKYTHLKSSIVHPRTCDLYSFRGR